jgi:deoxyribose-phosphate aldolase
MGKQTILHRIRRILKQSSANRIPAGEGAEQGLFDANLALMIDHTLLKPEATRSEIEKLCAEAIRYQFAGVCINPAYVKLCAQLLHNSDIKVCTVIGFPLGATSSEAKVFETEQAIKDGAREIDMVMNIGMLKSGEYEYVEQDILAVVRMAHRSRVLTKVIIETGLLADEEKVKACALVKHAGADFVKTSTGFAGRGATTGDVALLRKIVGPDVGVKASGGVRSREQALALIASGANRIGTSASVQIVTGKKTASPPTY